MNLFTVLFNPCITNRKFEKLSEAHYWMTAKVRLTVINYTNKHQGESTYWNFPHFNMNEAEI